MNSWTSFGTIARYIVGSVLLLSSVTKFVFLSEFRKALQVFAVSRILQRLSIVLPIIELTLSLLLLFRLFTPVTEGLTSALCVFFSGFVLWQVHHGRTQNSCGCFGPGGSRPSFRMAIRNAVFASLAIFAALVR